MPFFNHLWHWCWFASTGLFVLLFALLIRRGLTRAVPIFTFLVGFQAAGSCTLIAINRLDSVNGDQYWLVFAVIFAIKSVLSFAVLHEIFRHIFNDYPALTVLSTRLFRWATLVLIFIAIALAWWAPATGEGRQIASFFIVGRTFEVVLCGLVVFLLLFSKSIGLTSRSYLFGVALGLGIMASGILGSYAIGSQTESTIRTISRDVLDFISEFSVLTGAVVWVAYVFAFQPEDSTPTRNLPSTHDLETWSQELQRLLHQ